MNLITAPVLYALAALCLLLGIAAGVQTVRLSRAKGDTARVSQNFSAYKTKMMSLTAQAADKTRAAQQAFAIATATNEQAYRKGKDDAQATHAAMVADLRSGNLKLQQHWQGCVSTAARAAGTAAAAARTDAAADLRAEGAADIVWNADSADADIRWCQAELIATRELVKACGTGQ